MAIDLVARDCTVVTPEGRVSDVGVAVEDGRFVSVARDEQLPTGEADRVIEGDGRVLVPGLIDAHVHTREPGLEYKEDWETASRAAAAGGITTIVGMPNTQPAVDRPAVLERKFEGGRRRSLVDFQTFAAITSGNLDRIEALDEAGALGFKIFLGSTVGDVPPPSDGEILHAMERVAETGKRLGFHEENGEIVEFLEDRIRSAGRSEPIDHARSRPVIAEREAIDRMITFAEETGAPIHMFHVSSGAGAAAVRRGKERGVDLTAETTPHYLWFTEDVLRRVGNVARVQPPIRDAAERDRLWSVGIDGGAMDCIATDHAPHTAEEKLLDDPFGDTWTAVSGFVGLETAVPAMLTFVNRGRLSLERWVDLQARRPAQIWGLYPQKGSLAIGTDADFTIVDPEREWTLTDRSELHSKDPVSPFVGEEFRGRADVTVVRGSVVYEEGDFGVGPEYGSLIER